ncbi:hypothetical protein [Catellatospora tritici]|uniref:hypothetical protein n=1 Tax=Catellatospora tritici TaxID=2851566 RepID=UPI001C2D4DFA|nr:hypothetical protein [Catellatospora tritici]MBV1856348.1 hypothetical protein [Catellatospora tritici]
MNITMSVRPDPRVIRMWITGDVDLLEPCDVAISRRCLSLTRCATTVHVDLAGITFGGSALIHYLFALARRAEPGALHVHGAHGLVRAVIDHAFLAEVAMIHDDPVDGTGDLSAESLMLSAEPGTGRCGHSLCRGA